MATTRSGGDEIRASLASAIRNNFDYTNINGLTENPTITQNPTRRTQEPYIYIYNVGQSEIDSTKEETPYEYHLSIETCTRYDSYRGGQRQSNQMLDEVLKYVRTKNGATYPDLESVGYNVYNVTSGDIVEITDRIRGANYYKVIIDIFVTASRIEIPPLPQPIQEAVFLYADFMFTPDGHNRIERYDAGTITPVTTYGSNNRGWDFVDAQFTLGDMAAGTFDGTTYTVASGDTPLELDSTLNYQLSSDNTVMTSLQAANTWELIGSLRAGSITPDTPGTIPTIEDNALANTGLRNLANWDIEFGTITPHNYRVTVGGDAGDYVYIMTDASVPLVQINNTIGQNVISQFQQSTVGGYNIYINTQVIAFNGFSTDFTLVS